MNKIFYAYAHFRLDTDTPFYIGKGKTDRSFSKAGRNKLNGFRVNNTSLCYYFKYKE